VRGFQQIRQEYFRIKLQEDNFRCPGKTLILAYCTSSEVSDWCHRGASFRKKQPGVEDVMVIRPLHGPITRIDIVTMFSSLTAWDGFRNKVKDDPEFTALRKEMVEKDYFSGPPERFVYVTDR